MKKSIYNICGCQKFASVISELVPTQNDWSKIRKISKIQCDGNNVHYILKET